MYPTLLEIKELFKSNDIKKAAVKKELYADSYTTIEVLRSLKAESERVFLLESAENDKKCSRYSFLGYKPTLELTIRDHHYKISRSGVDQDGYTSDPKEVIRKIIDENKMVKQLGFPPFSGGLVGYFAYDYIKYSEPRLDVPLIEDVGHFNDVDLMLFDTFLAFDHYLNRIEIISLVDNENIEESYKKAEEKIDSVIALLKSGEKGVFEPLKVYGDLTPAMNEKEYITLVEKAKHYIKEGDIFQVVPSNPRKAKAEGSLIDVYRVMRSTNPSPYMFYFTSRDIEISGASPETLLKVENRKVFTFPLAGTRKRGESLEEDDELEKDLLSDAKEVSEHNMLVDLGRNDVGKVSKIGSVKVLKYMDIVKYSHVMHIGSEVEGTLRDDMDALNALDSILPAGTLSGAPKIRACEIISELEGRRRGLYGGAVGYIDFTGNLDTAIAIRLVYKKEGKIVVHTGGGVVIASDGEKEYEETLNKAKSSLLAIKRAEGGLDDIIA